MKKYWYRLVCLCLLALPLAATLHAEEQRAGMPVRIGLTPVFLDHQVAFNNEWKLYLEKHLGHPVIFIQRGSYREIAELLHDGKLDFAWLSGYPYVRNKDDLQLVAVPLYKRKPLYQSYIIVPASDKKTRTIQDLRGKSFAFADPDSNSGYLYIVYLLSKQGENPSTFFSRTFFAWSHVNVIEAVASGLAQGGAVDGYVWDTLVLTHPELTARNRILNRSPQFGSAPFVAGRAVSKAQLTQFQQVLVDMLHDKNGHNLLEQLNLNGFVYADEHLYDAIEQMSRFVEERKQ
ncbi:MAG: PhnD/SsuA/transferrin family substrate-binding protein [Sideroxydans sp.]|nr:PhnD/SsuA/transferrin family substrate-binding protein [Sideroxydans sp.]